MHSPGWKHPVVLIDDDPHVHDLIRRRLAKGGVQVPLVSLTNSIDAMVFFRATEVARVRHPEVTPCLALVDLRMPHVDGFSLIEWIRSRRALDAMPLYVLTSSDAEHDAERAAALGANGYWAKFPAATLLCATVRSVLSANHPLHAR